MAVTPDAETPDSTDYDQDGTGDVSSSSDDALDLDTTRHDNDVVTATVRFLDYTYEYVFKPRSRYLVSDGFTLTKFRVNGQTYNQPKAGRTGLPGERAAAERAFHRAHVKHDVTVHREAIGHKVPSDLAGVTPDDFTPVATDNLDVDPTIDFTLVRDRSGETLRPGDVIFDHYTSTFYEVGVIHSRAHGAISRSAEFRELGTHDYRRLNLSHVDLKLHRGRWEFLDDNVPIARLPTYETDTVTFAVGDIVTGLGDLDGLVDRSEHRIDAIHAVQGHGVRVVLVPETSLNAPPNELNIRAYPADELATALTP